MAFGPRKLRPREQLLPAYETELSAIVRAPLKRNQPIQTKRLRVETDHATLGRILKQRHVSRRLGYRSDKLAGFDLEVAYKPGKQNVVAMLLVGDLVS